MRLEFKSSSIYCIVCLNTSVGCAINTSCITTRSVNKIRNRGKRFVLVFAKSTHSLKVILKALAERMPICDDSCWNGKNHNKTIRLRWFCKTFWCYRNVLYPAILFPFHTP